MATTHPFLRLQALTLSSWRWSNSFLNPSQNSRWSQYTGYCNWNTTKLEQAPLWSVSISCLLETCTNSHMKGLKTATCLVLWGSSSSARSLRKNYPSLGQKYTIERLAEQVRRGKCSFASFCNQGEKGKDTRMILQWFCSMESWQIQTLLIAAGDTAALRISLSRKIIVQTHCFSSALELKRSHKRVGCWDFKEWFLICSYSGREAGY